ncbi:hypothetical protein TNCV_2280951 [Trichonephila clavipes]|nr:hypothetical protein TNCV_2280951 [Trichonephila clavipes]
MVQNDVAQSPRVGEQCDVNLHSRISTTPTSSWTALLVSSRGFEAFRCISALRFPIVVAAFASEWSWTGSSAGVVEMQWLDLNLKPNKSRGRIEELILVELIVAQNPHVDLVWKGESSRVFSSSLYYGSKIRIMSQRALDYCRFVF